MMWFKNLRTVVKLIATFTLLSAMSAAVGYVGVDGMDRLNRMLDTLYTRDMTGQRHAWAAKLAYVQIGRDLRKMFLEPEFAEKQKYGAVVLELERTFVQELDELDKTLVASEAKAKVAETRSLYPGYFASVKDVVELILAKRDADAIAGFGKATPLGYPLGIALDAVVKAKDDLGRQAYEDAGALFRSQRQQLLVLILVSVAGGVILGQVIGRLVSRPLGQAVKVLNAVAAGDFTARLEVQTTDEVGQMGRALNDATQKIRDALAEVRNVSADVASASEQLTGASTEISSGAQEQASSLEETAANLEEITAMVKRNSENAQQANRLAAGSREAAEAGGRVVQATIAAMSEITASSRKIADIISTIDEIAFQTNLLALNAAVEAARAGEQGRGFAVVAAEVRNLAQRSAVAAKEIKGLIQDSVAKVENGAQQVQQSGTTLEQIVGAVKRLTDIVGEIAAASGEQTTGIEQVNTAVTQMDTVTQANASQTEELSATAETLNGRAGQLRDLVERFKLETEGQRPAARPPAARQARLPKAPSPARRVSFDPPRVATTTLAPPTNGAANGHGGGRPDEGYEEF